MIKKRKRDFSTGGRRKRLIYMKVDLDATQDGGEVIFKIYRVGFIEDLLED